VTPCRNCHSREERAVYLDLGFQPLSNTYLTREQLDLPLKYYPIRPTRCEQCGLVQLENLVSPEETFSEDYHYFSGQSATWTQHLHQYAIEYRESLSLDRHSMVVEIASNDGTLLKIWRDLGIPALGIEPALNLAALSMVKGLATIPQFMGIELADKMLSEGFQGADLIVANNVACHVPSLDSFFGGIKRLLKDGGTLTVEVPDLEQSSFDQLYTEHLSYTGRHTARNILERRGFQVKDIVDLPTHGGSIRLVATHG
jgi:hypothetical protein